MEVLKIIQAYDILKAHGFQIVGSEGNAKTHPTSNWANIISDLLGGEDGPVGNMNRVTVRLEENARIGSHLNEEVDKCIIDLHKPIDMTIFNGMEVAGASQDSKQHQKEDGKSKVERNLFDLKLLELIDLKNDVDKIYCRGTFFDIAKKEMLLIGKIKDNVGKALLLKTMKLIKTSFIDRILEALTVKF